MYASEKEEILHLKDENKELKEQIAKMNANMNDMWREIIFLKDWKRQHEISLYKTIHPCNYRNNY